MSTFLSILLAAAFFCLIVVIHEFGHFMAAKLCGIKVFEFAIGMGPQIFKKQGKETLYSIRLLPIGGFCSMGEDIDDDDPNSFRRKPVWKKMIVIVAGAFMNLVLGLILSIALVFVNGGGTTSKIVYFSEDAASRQYGLMLEDKIVKINGVRIFSVKDITYQLSSDEDGVVDFVVERNGEKIAVNGVKFATKENPETGKRTLIYDFKVLKERPTAANFFPYAFKNSLYYGRIVLMSLGDIIKGRYGINDLQGPVGIVSTIGEITEKSGFKIDIFLDIATLVTINVGIFNLLPLPMLDGGRFVFLLAEAIRRKRLKAETEGMVHFIGFILLMGLMLVVTFNDIRKIFIR